MHGNPPLLHTYRTGPFRPTTALQMARVGVTASPWIWAKARSKLGALVCLCGDGVVSNEARIGGSFCMEIHPSCMHTHTHRTGPFRDTTALQMARVGVLASPWMWAKATTNLGAVIRMCGDRVLSNESRIGSLFMEIHPSSTQNRTAPTHHRTPDGPSSCVRLAMAVGESHKQTRLFDLPVRRQGGVE